MKNTKIVQDLRLTELHSSAEGLMEVLEKSKFELTYKDNPLHETIKFLLKDVERFPGVQARLETYNRAVSLYCDNVVQKLNHISIHNTISGAISLIKGNSDECINKL